MVRNSPIIGAEFDGRGRLVFRRLAEETKHRRRCQAKQNGVGTARKRERFGIVTIGGNPVGEEILSDDGGVGATGHVLRADIDEIVAIARRIGDGVERGVGVGREGKDVVDVVAPRSSIICSVKMVIAEPMSFRSVLRRVPFKVWVE